jgi:hypothetical protein
MSATNAPFGLVPLVSANGGVLRTKRGTIASGFATDMFMYSPVKLGTDGNVQAVTGTEAFVGAFLGAEWIDSNGIPQFGKWVGGTTVLSGTTAVCYYTEDPSIHYRIQADGAVAQSAMSEGANLSNIGGTGQFSSCTMSATTATGAVRQLQIRDLINDPANAWGDAFTMVEVSISNHQFTATINAF